VEIARQPALDRHRRGASDVDDDLARAIARDDSRRRLMLWYCSSAADLVR
jgi:hypothetical protein